MSIKTSQITSIVKGDEKEFRKFILEHSRAVYNYVHKILRNPEWTEEVVCDVFVTLWDKREVLPELDSIDAWIYRIAHNRAVSYLRQETRRASRLTNIPNPDVGGSEEFELRFAVAENEESDYDEETIRRLNKAISELPAKCRQVFYLIKFEKLTYREVASILNLSEKTISNHITLAMKRLSESFSKNNAFQ